ncbi:protein AHNAK2 [Grus japonensis]|uniref:Protein AHNAK2 n=1 Tax=Grus japonensis TaxID=30415 RepID=A0ABC9X054_GRUJA
MQTSEFTVSSAELSKTEISTSKIDNASSLPKEFPTCALTLQEHKVRSQDTEALKVESFIGLDASGVEFKRSSAEITVGAKLEDIMAEISGVKMDVKSARIDPEMEFQVESVEKDVSAGVEELVAERAHKKTHHLKDNNRQ